MFAAIIFLSSANYSNFVHLKIKTFSKISHSFCIQVIIFLKKQTKLQSKRLLFPPLYTLQNVLFVKLMNL